MPIELPAFVNRFAARGTHFVAHNLRLVQAGDDVCLDPEPTNAHDPRAIKVCVQRGNTLLPIGYVPRELCESIHHLLDSNAIWNTKIHSIGDEDGGSTLVLISFESTGLIGRQASVG